MKQMESTWSEQNLPVSDDTPNKRAEKNAQKRHRTDYAFLPTVRRNN